jgi:3D (Asp-Asp-Asp) domain-containing protein
MRPATLIRTAILLGTAMLAACSSTRIPAQKVKLAEPNAKSSAGGLPATKPARPISKSPSRFMYVRTTAYHHTEPGGRVTAVGGYLKPTHSAAADWSWLPAGTRFRIVETGEDYVIEDYGSALVGRYTIDIYKRSRREMNRWGVRYVTIEILKLGSYPVSLAVLKPRQKYWHVRQMVAGLRSKVRG